MSQFSRKLKVTPTNEEEINVSVDLEIEGQLDMLEAKVVGEGVGDEEATVDLDSEDEIASDVASSDAAAVTDIIRDTDASIHLDHLSLVEANVGHISIAKVCP